MSGRHFQVLDGREVQPDAPDDVRYFITCQHHDPKIETDVMMASEDELRQLKGRLDSVLEDN